MKKLLHSFLITVAISFTIIGGAIGLAHLLQWMTLQVAGPIAIFLVVWSMVYMVYSK